MSAAESKNFQMFRITLTELERLVDVRGKLPRDYSLMKTITEGIFHKLELLSDYDVNTSESNAFEELERLVNMRSKFIGQYEAHKSYENDLCSGELFEKMIGPKLDFIKKVSFSEVSSAGRVEPLAALERLTAVMEKFKTQEINNLVKFKIREVVWRTEAKACARMSVLP